MQPVARPAHLLGRVPRGRTFVQKVCEKHTVLFRYQLCSGEIFGEVLQGLDQAGHPEHFVSERRAGALIVILPVEVVNLAE